MDRSEYFGELQYIVNQLFDGNDRVTSIDLALFIEMRDYPEDFKELCLAVPYGTYTRAALCDKLNSSISGHGWGMVYGTVS